MPARKKERNVTYTVNELIEMARALSEGEFDRQFEQHFQGELGELASYLDAVRQTLQTISHAADSSYELIPAAADSVAEIHQETESGFESIWQVVEEMQTDQAMARELLAGMGDESKNGEVAQLREIATKSQQTLLSLMSYLSFQDVLRQRLEKVQGLIQKMEQKTMDLMVKFNVKANQALIAEGDGAQIPKKVDLDQSLVDQLLEGLK
jgi:methyl-accepting chemotaxis protein